MKSSLVSAAIGEMTKTEGEVNLYGSIAYAPQNPWYVSPLDHTPCFTSVRESDPFLFRIMSTTVRDNITFFHHFDPEFYELVLDGQSLLHFSIPWMCI